LAALTADLDDLAAEELDGLTDAALVEQTLGLRRLVDRLEGQWLQRLAAVDGRGAAGADQGPPAASTASWLRNRLHMGAAAAHTHLRTARALFRGPPDRHRHRGDHRGAVPGACRGAGRRHPRPPPPHRRRGGAGLLDAARRLDPPAAPRHHPPALCRRPEAADRQVALQHAQRGLWVAATLEGMVAVGGLLEPEAGQTLLAALDPLTRPANADDDRSGPQRRADALTELGRRNLEAGQLPQSGGVRPSCRWS
jgi:hypothetical protein